MAGITPWNRRVHRGSWRDHLDDLGRRFRSRGMTRVATGDGRVEQRRRAAKQEQSKQMHDFTSRGNVHARLSYRAGGAWAVVLSGGAPNANRIFFFNCCDWRL